MYKLNVMAVLGALATSMALAGCSPSGQQKAEVGAPRPVSVVTVSAEPLTLSAELPGRVEPVRVAEVRARVAGIVLARHFEEGADVNAGDLLFEIDPAPLKAAVSRAQGELARAKAVLYEAQARVKRFAPLVKIEAVSQQEFDSAMADQRGAEAAIRTAQADLETASLNLGYASVRAPISGRIGRAHVTEGALVGQGDVTLLARIQQLDPVYVDFTQSAAQVLRLREALRAGNLSADEGDALSVGVEGTPFQSRGSLMFADVSVDRGTGEVALRGKFANPGGVLLPGMYVRVLAPQGRDQHAILVPQRSVQRGPDGQAYVWVVGADGWAEVRGVTTGVMQDARWQIRDGLKPGDQVIVGGLAGLQAGTTVVAQQAQAQQTASQ